MATTQTTRRALIGGAGIAAVLATAPIAAASAPSTAEWDRLVARFQTLRQVESELTAEYGRRESLWFEERTKMGTAPVRPASRFDDTMTIRELRDATTEPAYLAAEAEYERRAADWRKRADAQRDAIMGNIEKAEDEARGIAVDALAAIRNYPAASFAMVEQKAEIIGSYYADQLEPHDVAAIMADIRRLNREARA